MEHKERIHNLAASKDLRRELRNNATAAEATLWGFLKKGQIDGLKFRRQHSVGEYVLDFYCPAKRLNIELDGGIHNEVMHDVHDEQRTNYLNALGITVLRYSNEVVFRQPEAICDSIRNFAAKNMFLGGFHKDEYIE